MKKSVCLLIVNRYICFNNKDNNYCYPNYLYHYFWTVFNVRDESVKQGFFTTADSFHNISKSHKLHLACEDSKQRIVITIIMVAPGPETTK